MRQERAAWAESAWLIARGDREREKMSAAGIFFRVFGTVSHGMREGFLLGISA